MIISSLWMLLTVIAKWLPHTANYSPEIAMTVYLASRYSFVKASILTLLTVSIADLGLAWLYHYPAWGWWSLFNVISLLLITAFFARPWLQWRCLDVVGRVVSAALLYWLVSNLGVWLSAGYYPMTLSGLLLCYDMALPFLPAQLMSGVAFAVLWWGLDKSQKIHYRLSHLRKAGVIQ